MPIHPLIKQVAEIVREEYAKPAPEYHLSIPTKEEMDFLEKEIIGSPSDFDQLNLRKEMWDGLVGGTNRVCAVESDYGRVVGVFVTNTQAHDVPWSMWMRIMRMFSASDEDTSNPYKVYFLANPHLREIPAAGSILPLEAPILPLHINGGYTVPCQRRGIVIYRAEDATRVLLHELFHAACCDNHALGLNIVEAETEAWAELFYCAFIARGVTHIMRDWVGRQSEWMAKQNAKVMALIGAKGAEAMVFPWRYTIGKQEVWERWGIFDGETRRPEIRVGNSFRLTLPPPAVVKAREDVGPKSVIL
jgi:hypothetical protein